MSSTSKSAFIITTHSRSLFNASQSPGWKDEETNVLRLALMKFGVGCWGKITRLGILPGKLIAQLNLQTQRLFGQQQLSGFAGLHVDPTKIRADNEERLKTDKTIATKSGLIINNSSNPTKESKAAKRVENQIKYGLTQEQIDAVSFDELFAVKRQLRLQHQSSVLAARQSKSTGKKKEASSSSEAADMDDIDVEGEDYDPYMGKGREELEANLVELKKELKKLYQNITPELTYYHDTDGYVPPVRTWYHGGHISVQALAARRAAASSSPLPPSLQPPPASAAVVPSSSSSNPNAKSSSSFKPITASPPFVSPASSPPPSDPIASVSWASSPSFSSPSSADAVPSLPSDNIAIQLSDPPSKPSNAKRKISPNDLEKKEEGEAPKKKAPAARKAASSSSSSSSSKGSKKPFDADAAFAARLQAEEEALAGYAYGYGYGYAAFGMDGDAQEDEDPDFRDEKAAKKRKKKTK